MGTARLKPKFIPPPTRHLETRSVIPDLSLVSTFLLFHLPSLFPSPTFFSRIDPFSSLTLIFSKMRKEGRLTIITLWIFREIEIVKIVFTRIYIRNGRIFYKFIMEMDKNDQSIKLFHKNIHHCSNLLFDLHIFLKRKKKRNYRTMSHFHRSFVCLPRHLSHARETKNAFPQYTFNRTEPRSAFDPRPFVDRQYADD